MPETSTESGRERRQAVAVEALLLPFNAALAEIPADLRSDDIDADLAWVVELVLQGSPDLAQEGQQLAERLTAAPGYQPVAAVLVGALAGIVGASRG